jgi:thiamine pyrophosphate-dependent acetolactate synthase large subunit-like protein
MKRYDALRQLAAQVTEEDLCVAVSLGATKNEWHSLMPGEGTMFLPLMGGSLPFGIGMAVAQPDRRIVVIDTDGSALFGAASLCTLANEAPPNLTALVLDNEMYESVGGHGSATRRVDLAQLAAGAGVAKAATAREADELGQVLADLLTDGEVGFAVAKIEPGREPLEPSQVKGTDAMEDKYRFLRHMERLLGRPIRPPVVPAG